LTIFPVLTPLFDLSRVALGSATLRPLVAPVEFVEIVSGGASSDIDIKFVVDELSDARERPEITIKSVRFCSPCEPRKRRTNRERSER